MSVTRCRIGPGCCQAGLAVLAFGATAPAFAAPDVVTRPIEVRAEPWPKTPATGPGLRQFLDSPVAGLTWRGVPLWDAVRESGEAFPVAIVRDRRIDPTRVIDLEVSNVPLRAVLDQVASKAGGELRIVGNVAYLGPPDAAPVVRTLAEMRRQELDAAVDRRIAARRVALLRGQTVRWGDLTEPAEVLRLVTERFRLRINNPELIPHDLWPGAVLPELSATEALTVILIQFDLTFAWGDDLASIRLVPLPDRAEIVVERSYTPRGSAEMTVAEWSERFRGLAARIQNGKVVVRATVERHEELEQADGGDAKRPPGSRPTAVVPLERRRFTLAVTRVPAKAVMAKLEESGIAFEYDANGLAAAGVDLDAPVTLDVKQADAEEFLEVLFGPLGVGFEIEGNMVRLRAGDAK